MPDNQIHFHHASKPDRITILGQLYLDDDQPQLKLPLYGERISAGFPSPADDYIESALDLNSMLVKNKAATFLVRVSGDSMIDAGIRDGDVLVVDRSEEAVHGKIVIAVLDGELTVKRLHLKDGACMLVPENPSFQPIRINSEQDLHVWGVVTGVVRKF